MKSLILAVVVAATTLLASPVDAQTQSPLSVPVTGSGSGLSLTGILSINRFVRTEDGVAVIGTLTGTVTTAAGATTSVVRTLTLPVSITQATCEILHLDIGPIALDLLGLQVNLSQIILDITAESGAGNLLGNLLCAVAGLLDSPGGLARLLNQILSLL